MGSGCSSYCLGAEKMTYPERIWVPTNKGHLDGNCSHEGDPESDVEYVRADCVANLRIQLERAKHYIEWIDQELHFVTRERNALRENMAAFMNETVGKALSLMPAPPVHLTVSQESADKIIKELK